MLGIGAFELGNLAATLLILRATELLTPGHGHEAAVQLGLALYTAYNVAATLVSVLAGMLGDRRGPSRVLLGGAVGFLAAYVLLALTGPSLALLACGFVLAGVGIGCAETAEHAAVATHAPVDLRGSAFGLLAALQSLGNFAASETARPSPRSLRDASSFARDAKSLLRQCMAGFDYCMGTACVVVRY
jgi:MFS family permease